MKMSKKSNRSKLWNRVLAKIEAGEFPAVFLAADGRLALEGVGCTLPPHIADLYPADLRAEAAQAARDRQAERQREVAEKRADERAVREQHGGRRIWRLAGHFVDEQSVARYTLAEIEAWLGWDGHNLRHNKPLIYAVAEISDNESDWYHLNISGYFANPCNDFKPRPSFDTLAARLREYVDSRRQASAGQN